MATPVLSCVGIWQKVMSLLHHQSHVWIDYVGDKIARLIKFPLQQHWLLLRKCVTDVNLHHLVQSK